MVLDAHGQPEPGARYRTLARSRCKRLGLTRERFSTVVDVVDGLLAVQAQEHAFSRWSLAQRLASASQAAVYDALASGAIVRTHVLRPTWHYVRGEDLRWLQALTGEIVRRASAGWYRNHGVDETFLASSRAVLERALEGGRAKTRNALRGELTAAGLDVKGQRLAAVLIDAELRALLCSGPVEGTQHTYALVEERLSRAAPLSQGEATVELVRRYLAGHGPATFKDLRWWSSLTLKRLRVAVEELGDEVAREVVDGTEYLWLAHDRVPDESPGDAPQFQLLQVFDELFVGYRESRGLVDPDGEFGAILPIGFSRLMHVVLEGDRSAGRWRSDRRGKSLEITVQAIR
ncbi:MAG TPA: winged helix DNA-binding domain-containing protein, partial [Trueperaceae bacterium]|nr:winged helix DNA-binding domain-containing protein [Trueperaceae bacterium]